MMPGRKRKAWCRGISPTLEPEAGARSPHSPPQTMLRFLHFPCMRLSRSFSAPFSLPRPSLSILFLYLLMLLLLLCHVFHSPESCLPGSHLSQLCPSAPWIFFPRARTHVLQSPSVLQPSPAAQGATPPFWGHIGLLLWLPSLGTCLLVCSQVRHGPWDWFLSPPLSSTPLSPPVRASQPPSNVFQPLWALWPSNPPVLPGRPYRGLCPQSLHLALFTRYQEVHLGRGLRAGGPRGLRP